jgi:acetyl esterase/lipase
MKSNSNFTRRDWLRMSMMGAAGLAGAGGGLSAAAPAGKAPAKAVIQIWMWGGPAHLDTFDPKPGAGRDYCGAFTSPLATNVDGVQIGEMLPLLARQADKYSIIRSMTHGNNGHETAAYIVQTGRQPDRLSWPGLGAIVSAFKGYDHGYRGLIPPYVVLTTTQGRFSECGFLGPKYKPFATGGDPAKTRFEVEGVIAAGLTDERQKRRRELLKQLDTLGRAMPAEMYFHELERCEDQAYEMILGDSRKVFDLSTESDALRDRYGRNTFGQSCLMARRLVEQGVPYVTINYKGWDTHKQHFEIMRRRLPEMDAGFATLLQDLSERGLLDSTIVWWGGEFGRTPKILWESPWNGGRNHFGNCFCSVLAGGGFAGGQIVGASNATGEEVKDRPVHPNDLLGSICERMGIDPEGPLPNPMGQDLKVMPDVVPGFGEDFGRLKELT